MIFGKEEKRLRSALAHWEGVADKMVRHCQDERARLCQDIMKEKAKARPNEKRLYAMEDKRAFVAELQNRILDGEWK